MLEMRFKKVYVVIVAVFWTCVQANPVQSEQKCGEIDVGSGLSIGGNPSKSNAWPWLVVLAHRIIGDRNFFCGGSLVSAKHVVTAAHCIQKKWRPKIRSERDFLVFVGKHNLKVDDEIDSAVHKVWRVILHEDWKFNDTQWDADIALIVLMTEVDLSNFRVVGIVCLPPPSEHEVTGTGTISGWGLSEETQKQKTAFSSTPNELRLPAVNQSVCETADERFEIPSSKRTFCAGYMNQKKAACEGDSGSGFYQLKERKYNLAGIVSVSLNDNSADCVTDFYTIFTDVAKFTDWIKIKMDETKKIIWEEVDFECGLKRRRFDGPFCEHKFTDPFKKNLKMKTDFQHASDALEVIIGFRTEFIFAGIGEIFANLKELEIKWEIKFIEKEDFIGLEKLETLNLDHNRIEFLPDDVFSGLSSLANLILSRNQIKELPERVFQNLPSLTSLDLRENQIKELPERVFQNLPSLTSLDLTGNKIKELPERVFWTLSSLRGLNLNSNHIKELPERVFGNLSSLRGLNLYNNQIETLPESVFWNLTNLTLLNLVANKIKALPEQVFRDLSKLTQLKLSYDEIKEVPSTVFINLTSLTEVNLRWPFLQNDLDYFILKGLVKPKSS